MKTRNRPGMRNLRRMSRTGVLSVMMVMAMLLGVGFDRVMMHASIAGAASGFASISNYPVLEDTYNLIRENYILEQDISDEDLVYGAAAGMVEALGDTDHSRFLDPQEAKQFEEASSGELIGIGVTIDTTGDQLVVIAPMPGSPAFEAGIKPGDIILAIDGKTVEELGGPQLAADTIRGEAGTDVTLEVLHPGDTESVSVTITRQKITINPVSWIMLPGDIMWLRLDQFSQGATDAVKKALQQGQELGMKGLIFDLRGNPGGLVVEALGVASQFMPDNTPLYTDIDNQGNSKVVTTSGSNGVYLEGDMVTLIDENSASAAELVSSSLKEAGRTKLYGETTFGTGTVLLPYDLDDGSIVLLGVELFKTGQGNDIYHTGVKPNVEVALPTGQTLAQPISYNDGGPTQVMDHSTFEDLEDAQLMAAYSALTGTPVASPAATPSN